MIAKSLDIAVILKLLVSGAGKTYAQLSQELGLSASEIHAAVRRGVEGNLIDPQSRKPYRRSLEEYLLHGVRYAFPARMGAISRGLPTAYAAPPLSKHIHGDELPPVWPHPEGRVRGQSVEPLYPSAPKAAALDGEFYEMLALVDALRIGRARERKLAEDEIRKRLAHAQSP